MTHPEILNSWTYLPRNEVPVMTKADKPVKDGIEKKISKNYKISWLQIN